MNVKRYLISLEQEEENAVFVWYADNKLDSEAENSKSSVSQQIPYVKKPVLK